MSSMTLTDAERQRVDQVDALVSRGASGVDPLVGMLDDPSWTVRRAVTSSLAALGDDAVVPLCRWLTDARTSEAGIAAAIDALAASLSQHVPARMIELLHDRRPAVVADAAIVLGRCRARSAVQALTSLLSHADDNVAMAAIEALGAIGGGIVVEPLIEVLEARSFFRTFPALHVLAGTADPRAIAAIARLLDDALYRDDAVRALGRTGSPEAVAPIATVLDPSTLGVVARACADLLEMARWNGAEAQVEAEMRRRFAARQDLFLAALAQESEDASALMAVLAVTGDATATATLARWIDHPTLRMAARRALAHTARREPAVIAALCANADPQCRAFALDLTTSRSETAVALAALADDDPDVRARACSALARLGAVEAVPRLFELLADRDPRVPHAASSAIDSLGSARARELASTAARSSDPQVRRHGLRIAGYLGVPDILELIAETLDSDDDKLRSSAIALLGTIDTPGAEAKLGELSSSSDERIRIAATRAAARRGGPAMAELLVRGITDPAAWVRYHACQGLGQLGDPDSTPLLIGRLSDPMPHVRIAAIEALSRMHSPLAWATLCSYARSADPEQQRVAVAGLALQDPDGAIDYLLAALEFPDPATRLVALSGLARARSPVALTAIARCAAGEAVELRDAAVSLLSERGDPAAARALIDIAINAPAGHPSRVALAQPSEVRANAIGDRLVTADVAAAQRLCGALGAMGAQAGAVAILFAQLASPNPAARAAAAAVLSANRVSAAASVISRLASDDPDAEVRAICAALGAR